MDRSSDEIAADLQGPVADRLRSHGLRPTRQRMALSTLLFEGPDRHVTAELLHDEARARGFDLSLATVYNTLHQFTEAGLMRQVVVDGDKTYFDTNISEHHHFFHEEKRLLSDIPAGSIRVEGLPPAPTGASIARVDVIVRLTGK
jgi:Fur family transcriptional regulator, iron response regulator